MGTTTQIRLSLKPLQAEILRLSMVAAQNEFRHSHACQLEDGHVELASEYEMEIIFIDQDLSSLEQGVFSKRQLRQWAKVVGYFAEFNSIEAEYWFLGRPHRCGTYELTYDEYRAEAKTLELKLSALLSTSTVRSQ
jgi:hypothetical protein